MSKKMRMLQILNLWRLIPAYLSESEVIAELTSRLRLDIRLIWNHL